MTSRWSNVVVATLCCLLTVATSASSAESWVLWTRFSSWGKYEVRGEWTSANFANVYSSRSECQDKITKMFGVPEPGSLGDWIDWMRSSGQYFQRQRTLNPADLKEGEVSLLRDDTTMTVISHNRMTEARCLPDILDPRSPKEK